MSVVYKKLEDVCEILDSRRVPITAKDRKAGTYPYYGANGLQDYVADYIFDDELVLLAEDGGNFGSKERPIAYRVSGKCWVNNHAHVLKAKPNMHVDYLCYALMFYDTEGLVNGATRQKLTQAAMRQMVIPYRDMTEQLQIIKKISQIVRSIEKRKEELQLLDQLVKSRFIELFGEPLSNQKGWQTMSIVEAAPIKSQRGNLADEVWLLNLDAVEAQTGTVLFKHRVQSGEINASTVYFTAESVLYSKLRPYLNKVVMPDEDGVATSEMIPMCPLADRLNRAYLCYWLRSDAFVRHISEKVAGTKMPRVSMDYFRSLAIEMPPLELQEQFAAFVEQTDKSKYYSSLSFRYCQAAANTYRQEWMTCRTSDF